MRPRTAVRVVVRPQPKLVPPAVLEGMRCAALSGIADPVEMLAVLDHVAIQGQVIAAIARRTEEDGTAEERARVAAALELSDEHAPIHVRIEFETRPMGLGGFATWLQTVREWTLEGVANLADVARVTATYRGESESWETRLP